MKHLRPLISIILSISLITLSPGLGTYQAMANVIGSAATAGKAGSVGVGAAGAVSIGAGMRLQVPLTPMQFKLDAGILPSVGAAPGVQASVAPSVLNTVSANGAVSASPEILPNAQISGGKTSRAPPVAQKEQRTVLQGLQIPMPSFAEMSGSSAKASAHTDFLSRIGAFKARGTGDVAAPKAGVFRSLSRAMSGLKAAKGASEDMPDHGPGVDRDSSPDSDDLDELGNERRRTDPGPDSVDDGSNNERGGDAGGVLFGFMPLLFAGSGLFLAPLLTAVSLPVMIGTYVGVVLPSLVLHEMGHAWVADKLGDPSARLAGRMSFGLKNLWNHVNKELSFSLFGHNVTIPLGLSFVMPIGLLTVSMLTIGTPILFGGARPVNVNSGNLASPAKGRSASKGMSLVALAGPAVNLGLAALAGLAHFGLMAAGVGGVILPILAASVWLNVLLAVFNLIPFAPLDGHHVGRSFLADTLGRPELAAKVYGTTDGYLTPAARAVNIYGLIGTVLFLLAPILAGVGLIASVFMTGSSWLVESGAVTASALLPALGALGLMIGNILGGNGTPDGPGFVPVQEIPEGTELIVRFTGTRQSLAEDLHLSLVDFSGGRGMDAYTSTVRLMSAQMEAAGMEMELLSGFGATPIATYARINAATLRLPINQAAGLRAALEARGYKVYENERREIVRPIEDDPNTLTPKADRGLSRGSAASHALGAADLARGAVSMEETLKISTMDKVHEEARRRWGSPQAEGWRARLLKLLLGTLGSKMAQPNIGVIDTGVEKEHPLIKPGLKAAKDVKVNGDGADENGHGTWVTSMVLWFAPWLKNITHYKIFGSGGGATLDDVLKGLTMAGNDKNIVISNSWGSDDGDPESPDSLLVKKLAEEGHIMVFAAGNAGYNGANSIGSPAISHYVDAKTNTPRVIAVAATDRNMAVSRFSSKGPGSRKTRQIPDYPRKPEAAEQGDNTEGAWLGGKTRAISGTSMSTPKFAGTIAMLAMLFGVTKVGEDLDRIVRAVMETLVNPQEEPETSIGDGFSAAYAAFEKLSESGFVPVKRGVVRRLVIWLLDTPRAPRGPVDGGKALT